VYLNPLKLGRVILVTDLANGKYYSGNWNKMRVLELTFANNSLKL